MIEYNDWRLTGQDKYLKEVFLTKVKPADYVSTLKNKQWHEHCEFCMDTIDAATDECYATIDYYRWICKDCFNDFKTLFSWKIV